MNFIRAIFSELCLERVFGLFASTSPCNTKTWFFTYLQMNLSAHIGGLNNFWETFSVSNQSVWDI